MGYLRELDALGRWVYGAAGLTGHRLSTAPPQVARPVILWEAQNRAGTTNLGNYHYTRRNSQYGVLYVNNLDQLARLVDALEKDLGRRLNMLPVFESDKAEAKVVGRLKKVSFEIGNTNTLDVPFTISYEATYERILPEVLPPARVVYNRLIEKGGL